MTNMWELSVSKLECRRLTQSLNCLSLLSMAIFAQNLNLYFFDEMTLLNPTNVKFEYKIEF